MPSSRRQRERRLRVLGLVWNALTEAPGLEVRACDYLNAWSNRAYGRESELRLGDPDPMDQ